MLQGYAAAPQGQNAGCRGKLHCSSPLWLCSWLLYTLETCMHEDDVTRRGGTNSKNAWQDVTNAGGGGGIPMLDTPSVCRGSRALMLTNSTARSQQPRRRVMCLYTNKTETGGSHVTPGLGTYQGNACYSCRFWSSVGNRCASVVPWHGHIG